MRRVSTPTLLSLIVGLLALTGNAYALAATARQSSAAQLNQSSTSLSTDDCVEADQGESVQISLYVDNSPELFAFEIYFAYDPDLLEVVDRNVRLFLSDGPNSNVFDFSDAVPNSTGIYRLGAADVALGGTAETGDGTLATITLRARDDGVSPAAIIRSPGFLGPRLTTVGGTKIDDFNGDEIFDGSITSGQIAIDTSCDPVAPTVKPGLIPTPTPTQPLSTSGGGGTPGSTAGPGSTGGATGDPTVIIQSPGTTVDPSPGSDPTPETDTTPDPATSQTPSRSPLVANNGSNSGGGAAGSGGADNTFWAVVLIGGGVTMGLVITYVLARMTRKPA